MPKVQYRARWAQALLVLFALAALPACQATRMGGANAGQPGMLTDGEILHIAMTSDMGEIVTSEPAVNKATNAQVRQFAQDMVAMHTQAAQQTRDVAGREGVALQPNQVSMTMDRSARGAAQKLNGMSGAQFDMMYLETQHTLHQHTLNDLDFVLIPDARDEQVRAHLTQKRGVVQQHLERVRQLIQAMM